MSYETALYLENCMIYTSLHLYIDYFTFTVCQIMLKIYDHVLKLYNDGIEDNFWTIVWLQHKHLNLTKLLLHKGIKSA